MVTIKTFIKYLLAKIFTLKFLQRLSQNIIWRDILKISTPKIVSSVTGNMKHEIWNKKVRDVVWDKVPEFIDTNKDILFLEFGVWEGYSIKYFANKYKSPGSKFYGFDTFTGMPENWRYMYEGHYNQEGSVPKTKDNRIKFLRGLFQKTLPSFLENLKEESKSKTIIIHLDAVLHSSTLFTLFKLDEYFREYYFIFDQLGTDECRAFNNFNDAKQKNFELLLMSEWNYAPEVVFGKYINNKN